MSLLWSLVNWVIAIFLLILGIGFFSFSIVAGIIMLLVALFILPPVANKLQFILQRPFGFILKTVIVIIGFIISSIIGGHQLIDRNVTKADQLIEQAISSINEGDINHANVLIDEAKSLYVDPDNTKAADLEESIIQSQSKENAYFELIHLSEDDYNLLMQGKLERQYFEIEYLNDQFLDLMKQTNPERAPYSVENANQEEQLLAENQEVDQELNRQPEQPGAASDSPTTDVLTAEDGFVRVGKSGFGFVNVPQDFVNFAEIGASVEMFQKCNRDKSFIITLMPLSKTISYDDQLKILLHKCQSDGPNVVLYETTVNNTKATALFQYYRDEDLYVHMWLLDEPETYKFFCIEHNGSQEELKNTIVASYNPYH